ncbi:MAG: methionyl-tRNA formyltransferase, partial [Chloroflexota bacterium]
PQPQCDAEATYTEPLRKHQAQIDWDMSVTHIWRRVRAFQPWPGCYTWWHGKRLKVLKATPVSGTTRQPGRVVNLADGGIGVQAADGILRLQQIQLEGKKQMGADEFLRGYRSFLGALLPS